MIRVVNNGEVVLITFVDGKIRLTVKKNGTVIKVVDDELIKDALKQVREFVDEDTFVMATDVLRAVLRVRKKENVPA
ncbi:hypothetical protein Csac_2601 [Caldicellulosiruptor saccharolyticus DSM 8903]|uniref:Uncharacterized protein n=1 Tax=Caldicellulosiruptor saccharolyticus (strain ATCC 43494 / DSM 8903 / Tp8T 6331) TaxID=351627 RepID=A4XMN8_CALS8|nr:hypothetical protein [Caldicellulosiruptor saccharolyticus]ABP68173.1 hypothetical protein Csac_2601 [Caldicellulosiruptor saccharolyticus DSM 8903]